MDTVWILGDQLNRSVGALRDCEPGDTRVLLVESQAKITSKRWHRQRLHVVLASMRRFAAELADEGFDVDHRQSSSLRAGLAEHRAEYRPDRVVAMRPMSWDGAAMLASEHVETVPNEQFLCSAEDFGDWMGDRANPRMEDFYRWQRRRLDVLMEGDEPVGGRWNFDDQNREPPPTDGRRWPEIAAFELDRLDADIVDNMPDTVWGEPPVGWWPTDRRQALQRLEEFVSTGLAAFGPHEDAMLGREWKLAHSVLASSLNLGLLHPAEVVAAAAQAHADGAVPINSAEGFIRQVMGWREYVWGLYWQWMPEYRDLDHLDANRSMPPFMTGAASTEMACLANVTAKVHDHGWAHHIERLMVLGNWFLLTGVRPAEVVDWMWASFVDGAEWVMVPNVIGMALYADGGRMATKPYAAGGAYINRMSDHCRGCRFDPRKRTGPTACPFTTLYWDFLARNRERLQGNHRMSRQLAGIDRLSDLDATRERAAEVLALVEAGRL